MSWDSAFFGRKIGALHIDYMQPESITESLAQARKDAFHYLLCKVDSHNISVTRILEAAGFYLTDIAVIWLYEMLDNTVDYQLTRNARLATERDIPMAREMVKSLFLQSRFYNDPFYSKEEADNLFQTWIENSIKGLAAHAVFLISDKGFITCRRVENNTGEIGLIGVKKDFQRRDIGKQLLLTALSWFHSQGISKVKVKTQLRNVPALNFYSALGFTITEYSLTFGIIL